MKYFFTIAILLFSFIGISAQETVINKAEFDKIMAENYRIAMNQPTRTTELMEHSGVGSSLKTRSIRERSGRAYRNIYEAESEVSSSKIETISINGKTYKKILDKPWTEEIVEKRTPPQSTVETISSESIYKSLGVEKIGGIETKKFKLTEKKETLNREKGYETSSNSTSTFWFDNTGLLIKSERITESILKSQPKENDTMIRKPTKTVMKTTTTIEIDASIKIEAPQIG